MEEYGVELSGEEQEKIDAAAASFLASNSKEALAELGADKEIVPGISPTFDYPAEDASGNHCGCGYECQ